jgi:hypothetical protein
VLMMTALMTNVMDKGNSKHVLRASENEKNVVYVGDLGESRCLILALYVPLHICIRYKTVIYQQKRVISVNKHR